MWHQRTSRSLCSLQREIKSTISFEGLRDSPKPGSLCQQSQLISFFPSYTMTQTPEIISEVEVAKGYESRTLWFVFSPYLILLSTGQSLEQNALPRKQSSDVALPLATSFLLPSRVTVRKRWSAAGGGSSPEHCCAGTLLLDSSLQDSEK